MSSPFPPPGDRPPRPPRPPNLSCDSDACASAKAAVVTARNVIVFKCSQVSAARSRQNVMAGVAAALLTAALFALGAAAAATATFFGASAALVLLFVAISLFATAVLFAAFAAIGAIQVAVLEGELGQARSGFITATERVTADCPTSCWGDLTMPAC